MTEVEKLYNNAGIEYGSCQNYSRLEECCNSTFCYSGMCPCGIGGEKNPFTAEKQIKLTQKIWELRPNIYPNFDLLVNYSYGEMIATFVNNRWQRLTEQEKEQIRNILKG